MSMPSLIQNVCTTQILYIMISIILYFDKMVLFHIYIDLERSVKGFLESMVEGRSLKAHMTCIKDTPKERTSRPLSSQGKSKSFVRFMRWA